jgi:hypothetical protein
LSVGQTEVSKTCSMAGIVDIGRILSRSWQKA